MAYGIVSEQAIEPMYDTKSIFDICTELAARLGVEQEFTDGKTVRTGSARLSTTPAKTTPTSPRGTSGRNGNLST